MSLTDTLTNRLQGEFKKAHANLGGWTLVSVGTTPFPAAALFVDDEGAGVTVQACDFVTGELAWQVTFTADAPLELVLVTARSAADSDR